jgi:methyltransferase (TIGR00027 family)
LVDIERYRANPFYHYLLARTRMFDRVFQDAITDRTRQVVFIGVGTDTRTVRFADAIAANGVTVVESDVEPWISHRAQLARRAWPNVAALRMALDLEGTELRNWAETADIDRNAKTLFLAEGVTPYVGADAIGSLLQFVSTYPPGSSVVYDFQREKSSRMSIRGDALRMPPSTAAVSAFHRRFGLGTRDVLWSDTLQESYLGYVPPEFDEDVITVATV